ncbi:MAG: ABC transporter permease [Patescibacteria group bacterium]|nr:ABC transporter permease [Patescibacteria group bacterium]
MKSLTRGHLKAGLDSVRGAKWRNFWTMLGIIIGVASVITIVSIGQGVKQQIGQQISHSGKNVITIRPGTLRANSSQSKSDFSVLSGLSITGSLRDSDVKTVQDTKGVSASAPLAAVATDVVGDNGLNKNSFVIGTSPDLPALINQSLAFGVFLTVDDEGMNAAVLGSTMADQLFNSDVPLGHSFKIHGEEFIVRGIFNDFGSTPLSDEANYNSTIFIPYDAAQRLTKNSAAIYEILAKTDSAKTVAPTIGSLQQSIKKGHGDQNDFNILRADESLAARSNVLSLLTNLISGVAAISLLVGGIGIMNVMLVSVTERMHEIGIRKAIGATNRQILSQFMIESSLLSFSGGVIGVVIAFIIDGLLRFFTNLRPVISWQVVGLAFGVSLVVGIIFGTVPALKAARKDPIEALRSQL